jgi:hypothetical protein
MDLVDWQLNAELGKSALRVTIVIDRPILFMNQLKFSKKIFK